MNDSRRSPSSPSPLLAALARPPAPSAACRRSGRAAPMRFAPRQLIVKFEGERRAAHACTLPAGVGVPQRGGRPAPQPRRRLRGAQLHRHGLGERPDAFPTTPAPLIGPPGPPGGWVSKQWNFLPWEGASTPALPDLARAASTRSVPGGTWKRPSAPVRGESRSPCSTPGSPTAARAAASGAARTSRRAVRQGLRLRRPRPPAARRKRPRDPHRRDDRREDEQRDRPDRARLPARS